MYRSTSGRRERCAAIYSGTDRGFTEKGLAYESDGALVVDIAQEGDAKEYPPCIVRKSDGAALYATSDLATIIEREQDFHPDRYIYVVDKRQELHFIQVFRVAKKAGIVKEDTPMIFLGFGTMNGKDGVRSRHVRAVLCVWST